MFFNGHLELIPVRGLITMFPDISRDIGAIRQGSIWLLLLYCFINPFIFIIIFYIIDELLIFLYPDFGQLVVVIPFSYGFVDICNNLVKFVLIGGSTLFEKAVRVLNSLKKTPLVVYSRQA